MIQPRTKRNKANINLDERLDKPIKCFVFRFRYRPTLKRKYVIVLRSC